MVGQGLHIRKIVCLLLLGTPAVVAYAQMPVMLSLVHDARAAGMANLGVATSPDANSQYFNVAKYAFYEKKGSVSVSYSPWLRTLADDMSMVYLSGAAKIGKENYLSGSLSYFDAGKVIMTNGGYGVGKYISEPSVSDWAVDLGYARSLSPYFSMGLAFRYVSAMYAEHGMLTIASTKAFAADVGFYYRYPFGKNLLTAGLAVNNVGSKFQFANNETAFLPMSMRLGVHYNMTFFEQHTLGVGLEGNKPLVPENDADAGVFAGAMKSFGNPVSQITFGLGAEYTWKQMLILRTGYFYDNYQSGNLSRLTCGAGIKYQRLRIDAAYWIPLASTKVLSNTFYITFGYVID